jgi:sortase A
MLFRITQRALLAVGLTLLIAFFAVLAYREVGSRLAVRSFHRAENPEPSVVTPAPAIVLSTTAPPDYSLWSNKRIAGFRDSLAAQFAPPVAILQIPKLRVDVAVFDGTDELILNRGVGRIIGSARVGQPGNVGIAGHRDGFFRCLKDIAVGDVVMLRSPSANTEYFVDEIEIVTPDDVRVLEPRAAPSITLVTCYPFYYSGDAPQRFIVYCSRRGSVPTAGPATAGLNNQEAPLN